MAPKQVTPKRERYERWVKILVFLADRKCSSFLDIKKYLGEDNDIAIFKTLSKLAKRGLIRRMWTKTEKRAKKIRIYCIKTV